MTRAFAVRAAALYGPVCAVLALWLLRPARRRMGAAVMLGVLWSLLGIAALQAANECAAWWTFAGRGPALLGMPLELYFGWVLLWGALPVMLFPRGRLVWAVLIFAAFDLVMMPLCAPVLALSPTWLVGETVGMACVFAPGWLLARATLDACWLGLRATLQMVLSGGLFLWLMPSLVFAARGSSWAAAMPRGRSLMLVAQAICLLALPGVSALQEFCERGLGTPIPQDPPQRLVTSGVYRYVANPMQVSCSLVMLVWGLALGSLWVAAVSAISVVYSAGIARWDEREDLRGRFGEPWVRLRAEVLDWRWRWRPYVLSSDEGTLYVAETCGVCSEVAAWFAARAPLGLRIMPTETYAASAHPGPKIRAGGNRLCGRGSGLERMRYVAADGTHADGVAAFARGLEHINAAWMLLGSAMRLPGVDWCMQTIADAVGFGPVKIGGGLAHNDEAVVNGASASKVR